MKHFALVTAATLLAAPAFAGGPITPVEEPMVEPVMVAPPSFDWSGFYAGAQLGYGDIDSNGAGLDGNGAIGGIHAGYRLDYGQFVGGLGLDYDVTNIDLGATDKLDHVARLKLTAGYDLGRTLVYGTAGAAYATARVGGVDRSDNGYFYGLGADYALTDQWIIGGEVLQHNFNNFDGTGVDLDALTAQMKVSFRF